jgi:hypothetical protein
MLGEVLSKYDEVESLLICLVFFLITLLFSAMIAGEIVFKEPLLALFYYYFLSASAVPRSKIILLLFLLNLGVSTFKY